MITSLFSKTPSVKVLDNRGLTVRDIAYHRHPDSPQVTNERITRYQYDDYGLLEQSADARLHDAGLVNVTYLRDLTGSVLCTQSVDSGITMALNDAAGRPLVMVSNISTNDDGTDDRSQAVTRTWQYEDVTKLGRPLSVTERRDGEAARISERFVYAGNTNAEKALNLAGVCVSYYDTAGLVQTDSIALNGVPLSVSRRLIKEADNPDVITDWQGDNTSAWNRLLAAESFTTLSTADAHGAVLSTTDAKGHVQRVEYNVVGLLSGSWLRVKGGAEQVIVKSLTYSAAGQKLREEHGNGVVTTYTYEPQTQRLIGIKTERPSGHASGAKVLQDLRYEYDPVGNVLNIHNDAEETRFWRNQKVVPENTYTYDSLYQLVSATGREMASAGEQSSRLPCPTSPLPTDNAAYTNYSRSYTYDSAGNLIQISHSSPAINNCYTTDITVSDRSNRGVLSTLTKSPSEVDALFTAGGQQKQLQPGQSLIWTPRNELLKVTPVARVEMTDDSESYRYDGSSQRILKVSTQKTNNSMQTQRVVYLPGVELRTTTSGSKEKESLQVISVSEAGRAQVRVLHWAVGKPADLSNDSVRYSYGNLTGSSTLELDADGNLISMEEYYPYGGTAVWASRSAVEADYRTVRYSGKERDATGLYYYGYRYYQPWVGRWLSSDPAGTIDGLNLFRMCRNNPVMFADSDGLVAEHLGWELVTADGSVQLNEEEFLRAVSKEIRTIFIVGDGHKTPPFQYADKIPGVADALKSSNLRLYVEFTKADFKEAVAKSRAYSEGVFKKDWMPFRKNEASIVGWEPEISNLANKMFSLLAQESMTIEEYQQLTHDAKTFHNELHTLNPDLANNVGKLVNEVTSKGIRKAEVEKFSLMTILGGYWRDAYINKYLGEKIAVDANRNPGATFLISVGDAHLDERFNPVQKHLNHYLAQMDGMPTHQILINKSKLWV